MGGFVRIQVDLFIRYSILNLKINVGLSGGSTYDQGRVTLI